MLEEWVGEADGQLGPEQVKVGGALREGGGCNRAFWRFCIVRRALVGVGVTCSSSCGRLDGT